MSELSPTERHAAQLCRGLTAREAGRLVMAIHPVHAYTPPPGSPVASALSRGLHHRRAGLWRAILARHSDAASQSWSRAHVTWREAISRRESPALLASLGCPSPSDVATWIQHTVASRLGWLDPRHRWELQHGRAVELGQLPWLDASELELWLNAFGVRLLAAALRRAGRREVALLCRNLRDEHAAALIGHLGAPETLSEGARRLCRQGMLSPVGGSRRRGAAPLDRILALGLFGASAMRGHRYGEAVTAMAHALPLDYGQALLSACKTAPVGPKMPAIGEELVALGLVTLQRLARQGLTQHPHHTRQALVRPPAALIGDEDLEALP